MAVISKPPETVDVDGKRIKVSRQIKTAKKWGIFKLENGMHVIRYRRDDGAIAGYLIRNMLQIDRTGLKGSVVAAIDYWNTNHGK